MPKMTDTYSLAYECCDLVLGETQRFPTIDAIRARIGVNSPTTIKKAINDWTVAFAEKHFHSMHRPEVPVVLQDATESLWKLALKESAEIYRAQTEQHLAEREALNRHIEDLKDRLAARDQELLQLSQAVNQLEFTLSELSAQLIERQNDLDDFQQQNRLLTMNQEKLEQQLTSEREQWQAHTQQNETWYQQRIVEERDLAAEKWQAQVRHLEALKSLLESNAVQLTQHNAQMGERIKFLAENVKTLEAKQSQQRNENKRWKNLSPKRQRKTV